MNKKYVLFGIIVLAVIAIYVYRNQPKKNETSTIVNTDKTATYNCPKGKFIKATFHLPEDKTVDIVLSDGRKITVTHTISGSGARYANKDESFVFWNKGDTAFTEEKGKTTYDNCVTSNNDTSTSLANPASVNCGKVGGNLVIQKNQDGSEYGMCYFGKNKGCEEWALFRGECPVGGKQL